MRVPSLAMLEFDEEDGFIFIGKKKGEKTGSNTFRSSKRIIEPSCP
jgi:hypothetical protein